MKVPKSSLVRIPKWFDDLYRNVYHRTNTHYDYDKGMLIGYRMYLLGKQQNERNKDSIDF